MIPRGKNLENMELEELIKNTLRRKHFEEMMNRPIKEHTPLDGMDNKQIRRFALFLFEKNQNKIKQHDEMIARLDEIGKDLKVANKKIDTLTSELLKTKRNAEKDALGCKKLEIENKVLAERLSLMNAQTYASSKILKGIDRKKSSKGKHDDKDDFDGTPQSLAPTEEPAEHPQESKIPKKSKGRPGKKA